jgi:hypothetical protein
MIYIIIINVIAFDCKFTDDVLIVRTLEDFLIQNFIFINRKTACYQKLLSCLVVFVL